MLPWQGDRIRARALQDRGVGSSPVLRGPAIVPAMGSRIGSLSGAFKEKMGIRQVLDPINRDRSQTASASACDRSGVPEPTDLNSRDPPTLPGEPG